MYSENCDICGKPAMFHTADGKGNTLSSLCNHCHNEEMAVLYDTDVPDNIPDKLSFTVRRKTSEFDIEFIIFGTGKSLTATETGLTRRKVGVWGNLDDDFDEMMITLKNRIKNALSVKYMGKNRTIKDTKLVGYIEYNRERDDYDIYVDGIPYTWDELGKNISIHEGWKVKIEFAEIGNDLE